VKLSQFLLLITTIFTLFFLVSQNSFSQPEIPTKFSKFQSDEYEIEIEYPSNWEIFGDIKPGDYLGIIAIFAPVEETQKFKNFDSVKDYQKLDYRVLVMIDYKYTNPKLNLNYLLDDKINLFSHGLKGFELIDSTTKSKLGDKRAYQFTYLTEGKKDYAKFLHIGTITDENQQIWINFRASAEYFDLFLPTFQHMIDSFKFGQFENNSSNTESTAVITTNQEAIKNIFENDDG
jgi:hypothetical protein